MHYEQFLIEHEILPIDCEKGKWNRFLIHHQSPKDEMSKQEVKRYIGQQVGNRNGLYVYKNEQGEILYIGKGKPLKNRLISHYIESFQPVSGDTKDQRWHKFFSQHQGIMEVWWIELEGEKERQIIEKMLDNLLKPLFSVSSRQNIKPNYVHKLND